MNRIVLCLAAAFLVVFTTRAQQTATNFITVDCQGNTHNLFSQLEEGKVIVLCWVMPCSPCIGPAFTTYKVVESFQATHPGRVYFYMADDYANTSCNALGAWANNYNMPLSSFSYRFSDPAIRMLDYGSDGMPKIVVIGGPNKEVHYNINDEVNANDLQTAITNALLVAGINEKENSLAQLKIKRINENVLTISMYLDKFSHLNIQLLDLAGKPSMNINETGIDDMLIHLNTSGLKSGIYIVRVIRNETEVSVRKIFIY